MEGDTLTQLITAIVVIINIVWSWFQQKKIGELKKEQIQLDRQMLVMSSGRSQENKGIV